MKSKTKPWVQNWGFVKPNSYLPMSQNNKGSKIMYAEFISVDIDTNSITLDNFYSYAHLRAVLTDTLKKKIASIQLKAITVTLK